MTNQIFTATGCSRCKITKGYMADNAIAYEEYDIKAEGKQTFSQFYRANRSNIYRSADGVEFPVFTNGKTIRQGVGAIVAYLMAQDRLDGFISTGTLHGQWLDGIDISGGNPENSEDLIKVLTFLKLNGLQLQMTTDGHNATVFETIVDKKLCDRVIMEVRGPFDLYDKLSGRPIDEAELNRSVKLASKCPEYHFFTTICPVPDDNGVRYLTPEEIAEATKLINDATGSKKHPYEIRSVDSDQNKKNAYKDIEPLTDAAMFKYRTAARRYMVMAEIKK
jgi:glutaredoxin